MQQIAREWRISAKSDKLLNRMVNFRVKDDRNNSAGGRSVIAKKLQRVGTLVAVAALIGLPAGPALAKKKKLPPPVAAAPAPRPVIKIDWQANPAAARLAIDILRRSTLEGLADGAVLAASAEAALARAATGGPAEKAVADQALTNGWVRYVQMLNAPIPGVIYGDEYRRPRGKSAEAVIFAASHAPSLEAHLAAVASVNPLYDQLRAAAWNNGARDPSLSDAKVAANLARLRALPEKGRAILVDSATQRLWMFEDGRAVDSMKVIVGMRELPTPMIVSTVYYGTFNPYWHVPPHLVRKTVAPKTKAGGLAYLKSHGYQVVSEWSDTAALVDPKTIDWAAAAAGTLEPKIRQLPGPGNSMGKLKFNFPNPEGIYLHDTPSKDLFNKTQRTLSNGCIRLEDAQRLGRWLFKGAMPSTSDVESHIKLPESVPVVVTYLTLQTDQGKLTQVADVYSRDPAGAPLVASSQAGGGN